MGKINPNFVESINESIASIIVDIIDKIEDSSEIDPNIVVKNYIDNFRKQKKEIKNQFSEELLDYVKSNIIEEIYEINEEYFLITEETRDKLISFCIDYIINGFSEFHKSIEIN